MAAQEKSSFYDRLGGVSNIATVVDDLIDRVMVGDRLKPTPGDERLTIEPRQPGLRNRTGVPGRRRTTTVFGPYNARFV